MTESNRNTPAQARSEQEEEIRSDLEKLQPEGITIGDRIKDVVSTMKREDILEPYHSADKTDSNPDEPK